VKARRMLVIVSVAAVLAGPAAWAQNPPAPTEPAPESDRPLGDDEAMVLNFERADIREVIHSLATALGISYTLDPRIEGQVTIRTTGKISRRELFPLFSQILRQNGIAAVKTGNIYQILPVAEAKTRAIIRRGAAAAGARRDDDFVIQIFQVRHVLAEEMANILQPFVTPGGDVLSYARANAVVVTDLESNVQRLRQLAATFDIDGFRNLHARVFKMREGNPEALANELLTLLAPYGVTATGEGEGGVFMVPLQRLNAIVGFAVDPAAFSEMDRWLMMLDIPPDKGAGRQTFVYNVENAKAADLAAVLNELFGGGERGGGPGRGQPGQPGGVGLFGPGGAAGRGAGGSGAGRGETTGRRTGVGGGASR
jgi:general secretion pathway protein D